MRQTVEKVMDARLADLLARWRAARTEGSLGDPAARLAPHGDHLLVIEFDGSRTRYAHYGAAFAQRFGADLTGAVIDMLPSDILPTERRGMLAFEYAYARQSNRPLWRSYTADFADPEGRVRPETWQRLVLPLGDGRLVVGAYPVESRVIEGGDDATRLLRLVIERVPLELDETGGILDLALSLRAFCDTQQQVSELEVLATRDPLTGVSNLRHFRHLADLELEHARRMGRSLALLALDIDHFKSVNDRFGHAAGDEALRAFVAACRLALREYDVLGRLGGEEFAVALPNTGPEGAATIAERLRRQVEEAVVNPTGQVAFRMTVSIGVAAWVCGEPAEGADTPDIPALLKRADAALYRAKAGGRNRVVVAEG